MASGAFKAFQQEVAKLQGSVKKMAIHDTEDEAIAQTAAPVVEIPDEGRNWRDRLLTPTESTTHSLSLLLRRLIDEQDEALLFLGSHNLLHSTTNSSLLSTSPLPRPPLSTSTSTSPVLLTSTELNLALSTLTTSASLSQCSISLLFNPFDPVTGTLSPSLQRTSDHPSPGTAPHGGEGKSGLVAESAASANDEKTTERWVADSVVVLVRRIPEGAQDLIDLRMAAVGNVDAGKSTLMSVLTKGRLDNGRGSARVSLFRHKHEIETGRTSSVGMEILGFTSDGKEVIADSAIAGGQTQAPKRQQMTWNHICEKAAKIITFIDLAGHERYLKTTIRGMTGHLPNYVMLIVGANAGMIGMAKEHLSVALALNLPVIIVVTKIDMTPANVTEQNLKQLAKIIRSPGCRKQPVFVKNRGMACELAKSFVQEKACPIFTVSSVSGQGLDALRIFLNGLPAEAESTASTAPEDLEFTISDIYSVPFVGSVVSGVIVSGTASIGDNIYLGPETNGSWIPTQIKDMQRKRVRVQTARPGQAVTFALKRVRRENIRKGMVILARTEGQPPPTSSKVFEGNVLVLYHNTTIQPNYQAMLHMKGISQTVKILSMDKEVVRTGDRAIVRFEWIKKHEFIRPGWVFLMREGKTHVVGVVSSTS